MRLRKVGRIEFYQPMFDKDDKSMQEMTKMIQDTEDYSVVPDEEAWSKGDGGTFYIYKKINKQPNAQ
jgi:hypothetical protein